MTKKELLAELMKKENRKQLEKAGAEISKLSKMKVKELENLLASLSSVAIVKEPEKETPSFTPEQLSSFKANACAEDLFGNAFDADSDSCILCLQENEEVALACQEITLAIIVEKKATPAKKATSKKELNAWGHGVTTKAALIDDALLKAGDTGITIEELAKVSGRTATGVSAHLHHLRKERNINVVQVEGKPKGTVAFVPEKKGD